MPYSKTVKSTSVLHLCVFSPLDLNLKAMSSKTFRVLMVVEIHFIILSFKGEASPSIYADWVSGG